MMGNIRQLLFSVIGLTAMGSQAVGDPGQTPVLPSDTENETVLKCHVEEIQVAHGLVKLVGMAEVAEPITGRYSFQVKKKDSAGQSQTSQSGEFQVTPEKGATRVANVSISLQPEGFYEATLTLRWGENEQKCVRTQDGVKKRYVPAPGVPI